MLVLFDTPAGHALFTVKKPDKLKKGADVFEYFCDPAAASKMCAGRRHALNCAPPCPAVCGPHRRRRARARRARATGADP